MNSNLQIICEFVFKRIVPPILKAQALTLGVGPPLWVGASVIGCLVDSLVTICSGHLMPSRASSQLWPHWLRESGSERGGLDCSGDGCFEFGEYRNRAIAVMMHKNLCYVLSSLSKAYMLGTIRHPNQLVKDLSSHSRQARRGP